MAVFDGILEVAGNWWKGVPAPIYFDMYQNDIDFDDAATNYNDAQIEADFGGGPFPLDEELIAADFENGMFDDLVVEKTIYQIDHPDATMTPYGPGLLPEEMERAVAEYPSLMALTAAPDEGVDSDDYYAGWDTHFDMADEFYEGAEDEINFAMEAVELQTANEGAIGDELTFIERVGQQIQQAVGDVLGATATDVAAMPSAVEPEAMTVYGAGSENWPYSVKPLSLNEILGKPAEDLWLQQLAGGDGVEPDAISVKPSLPTSLSKPAEDLWVQQLTGGDAEQKETDDAAGVELGSPLKGGGLNEAIDFGKGVLGNLGEKLQKGFQRGETGDLLFGGTPSALINLFGDDPVTGRIPDTRAMNSLIKDGETVDEVIKQLSVLYGDVGHGPHEIMAWIRSKDFAEGVRKFGGDPDVYRRRIMSEFDLAGPLAKDPSVAPVSQIKQDFPSAYGADPELAVPMLGAESLTESLLEKDFPGGQGPDFVYGPSSTLETSGVGDLVTTEGQDVAVGDTGLVSVTSARKGSTPGEGINWGEDLRKVFYERMYAEPGVGRSDVRKQLPNVFSQTRAMFLALYGGGLWNNIKTIEDTLSDEADVATSKQTLEHQYSRFLTMYLSNPAEVLAHPDVRARSMEIVNILSRYQDNPDLTTWSVDDEQKYIWMDALFGGVNNSNTLALININLTGGGMGYYSQAIQSSASRVMDYYRNIGWSEADIFKRMMGPGGQMDTEDAVARVLQKEETGETGAELLGTGAADGLDPAVALEDRDHMKTFQEQMPVPLNEYFRLSDALSRDPMFTEEELVTAALEDEDHMKTLAAQMPLPTRDPITTFVTRAGGGDPFGMAAGMDWGLPGEEGIPGVGLVQFDPEYAPGM